LLGDGARRGTAELPPCYGFITQLHPWEKRFRYMRNEEGECQATENEHTSPGYCTSDKGMERQEAQMQETRNLDSLLNSKKLTPETDTAALQKRIEQLENMLLLQGQAENRALNEKIRDLETQLRRETQQRIECEEVSNYLVQHYRQLAPPGISILEVSDLREALRETQENEMKQRALADRHVRELENELQEAERREQLLLADAGIQQRQSPFIFQIHRTFVRQVKGKCALAITTWNQAMLLEKGKAELARQLGSKASKARPMSRASTSRAPNLSLLGAAGFRLRGAYAAKTSTSS